MTIDEAISLFLDDRETGHAAGKECSKKTLESYKYNLLIMRNWFLSEAGVTKYEAMTREQMKQFREWAEAKVISGRWSKATKIALFGVLRTFFLWVGQDEDLQQAGLQSYKRWLPPIGEKPNRIDIPPLADMKSFIEGFNTEDLWEYRDFVLTSLLIDTGMRIGEACNLRLEGLRLEERILHVEGKTGRRTVPMTVDMVRILRGWIKRRAVCRYAKDSPYVFVSKRAPKLNEGAIAQSFIKHRAKLGLPRISAHTFRHAYATNYLEEGGNMEYLRINMGHQTYEMLRKYLHLSQQRSKKSQTELERVSLLKKV